MTPDELRSLADAIVYRDSLAIARAADYLRAQADAQPVAWLYYSKHASQPFTTTCPPNTWGPNADDDRKTAVALYTHPAPAAPQDEPQREPVSDSRPCTCHPDDNPPVPCARKYALSECRAASGEPTEAQIKARDALLDFISENGTASEGVQHYLDRYVRAALAAKE